MRWMRCFTIGALAAWCSVASAEGWLDPLSLNPFAAKQESEDTSPDTRLTFDPDEENERRESAHSPTFPSSRKTTTSASPSIWKRATGGTKAFFAKTTRALTPWKKKTTTESMTGSRYYRRPAFKPEEKKKGFFSSLFAPQEEPGPRTVSEWIDLPRPH